MLDCTCSTLWRFTLPEWALWLRLIILITSFVALVAFGEHMLRDVEPDAPRWTITFFLLALFGLSGVLIHLVHSLGDISWRISLDVLARYLLGIPGAIVACVALWQQRQVFRERNLSEFAGWLNPAVVALGMYGIIGQMFPASSPVFPSTLINSDLFLELFGFPVQLLRAGLAVIIAVSMIQVLRVLEVDSQARIRAVEQARIQADRERKQELELLNAELRQAQAETERLLSEVQRRDARRGELLQNITAAQESERRRIARELHDDTGQVLTGLGLGLRGMTYLVDNQPEVARQRLNELQDITADAIAGLRYLINDLRPPQLDDMGLMAALRSMQERLDDTTRLDVTIKGEPFALPVEVETALFRIAQEAVTNAMKHARATRITVTLDFTDCLRLSVIDNGRGFDVQHALAEPQQGQRTSWGLLGMQERARLINAELEIESSADTGTRLIITMNELCGKDREI
jgi:signal transduction histidine kinase